MVPNWKQLIYKSCWSIFIGKWLGRSSKKQWIARIIWTTSLSSDVPWNNDRISCKTIPSIISPIGLSVVPTVCICNDRARSFKMFASFGKNIRTWALSTSWSQFSPSEVDRPSLVGKLCSNRQNIWQTLQVSWKFSRGGGDNDAGNTSELDEDEDQLGKWQTVWYYAIHETGLGMYKHHHRKLLGHVVAKYSDTCSSIWLWVRLAAIFHTI